MKITNPTTRLLKTPLSKINNGSSKIQNNSSNSISDFPKIEQDFLKALQNFDQCDEKTSRIAVERLASNANQFLEALEKLPSADLELKRKDFEKSFANLIDTLNKKQGLFKRGSNQELKGAIPPFIASMVKLIEFTLVVNMVNQVRKNLFSTFVSTCNTELDMMSTANRLGS